MTVCKRLAITPGEPGGIGPDIVCKLAEQQQSQQLIIIGSEEMMLQRAKQLGIALKLLPFDPAKPPQAATKGEMYIHNVDLNMPAVAQQLNPENSDYVLQTLQTAHQLCIQGHVDVLVTGPIHKAHIEQSLNIKFCGHTEYLGQLANTDTLMCFYSSQIIVAVLTSHLALKNVSSAITPELLIKKINIFNTGLQNWFKISTPHIGVCGLNPHAGENGILGDEEITTISPAIKELKQSGLNITGPIPADTAFTKQNRQQYAGIMAMYHDQGLTPIKALAFGETVNVTFGLPYLRTSVDHGTALHLAGTNKADSRHLQQAINLAARL